MASYSPVRCSPERFFELFLDRFEDWDEYGFQEFERFDIGSARNYNSILVWHPSSKRRGVYINTCSNVEVRAYSETRKFSRDRKVDLGSVSIWAGEYVDEKLTLTDLQNLTGVTLRKVF